MLGNKKWISQYINLHKKIYEIDNITTMERIEAACEKYKSNCFFDIENEDVIEVTAKTHLDVCSARQTIVPFSLRIET